MTANRLRVGLPVSLSGEFSLQGKQVLTGVERWIQWTNDRGGVTVTEDERLPLELVQYDDRSDPETAGELTEQLIKDDEVDFLFGPYSSRLTLAAAPEADDHEMVLWNHSGATDALYDKGFEWLVSILSPASHYFHGVLDLIHRIDPSASRIAACWSSSGSFGQAVSLGMKQRAQELGFTISREHPWESSLGNPTSIIESIREVNPHLVLVVGSFDDDTHLVKELVARNISTKAIGAVAAGISAFGEQLGEAASGVFGPSQWEPHPEFTPDYGPSPTDVIDLFETIGVKPTDYPTAQAFAAGIVIEACLTMSDAYDPKTSSIDQRQLYLAAETANFTTFFGRFRIDSETGKQVGHTPAIVQWHQNKKQLVWPEDRRQVDPQYPTHWNHP